MSRELSDQSSKSYSQHKYILVSDGRDEWLQSELSFSLFSKAESP